MARAVDFHEEKARKTSFLTTLYSLSQYQNKQTQTSSCFIEKAIKTREVSYAKNCYSFVVTTIKLLYC